MPRFGQKKPAKEVAYERYEAPIVHDSQENKRVKEFWEKIKVARETEKNKSTKTE